VRGGGAEGSITADIRKATCEALPQAQLRWLARHDAALSNLAARRGVAALEGPTLWPGGRRRECELTQAAFRANELERLCGRPAEQFDSASVRTEARVLNFAIYGAKRSTKARSEISSGHQEQWPVSAVGTRRPRRCRSSGCPPRCAELEVLVTVDSTGQV
jgi:hypothetical protein